MNKYHTAIILVCVTALLLGINRYNKGLTAGGKVLHPGDKLYSQHNEELIIRDFFNDMRGGVFVDLGASDYKKLSTTFYLEERLGWSGIAIDALPEYAEGYIKYRPKTKFFNYMVTRSAQGPMPFYRLMADPPRSSSDKKAMEKSAKKKKIMTEYELLYVPTITLDGLLEKNGMKKIDFLSIDIEGAEPDALAGFDIGRFKPRLVCVEANKPAELLKYFNRHNYELIWKYLLYDHVNWYFKPKGS